MKKKYGNTLFIKFSCNRLLSCPGKLCKDSVKPIQGCAEDLFESFPFVLRIVYCNVCHHGNNPGSAAIYSRERSRVMQWHHMRWEKVWLQMVGTNRFLPWQLSQNLAKYNENYLTYVYNYNNLCLQLYMASQKSLFIPIYLHIVICRIMNRMLLFKFILNGELHVCISCFVNSLI